MSGTHGRNGKCGMGCDYACWYHNTRVMGTSISLGAALAAAVAGRRVQVVPSKTAASVMVGKRVGLSLAQMSSMSGAIIGV